MGEAPGAGDPGVRLVALQHAGHRLAQHHAFLRPGVTVLAPAGVEHERLPRRAAGHLLQVGDPDIGRARHLGGDEALEHRGHLTGRLGVEGIAALAERVQARRRGRHRLPLPMQHARQQLDDLAVGGTKLGRVRGCSREVQRFHRPHQRLLQPPIVLGELVRREVTLAVRVGSSSQVALPHDVGRATRPDRPLDTSQRLLDVEVVLQQGARLERPLGFDPVEEREDVGHPLGDRGPASAGSSTCSLVLAMPSRSSLSDGWVITRVLPGQRYGQPSGSSGPPSVLGLSSGGPKLATESPYHTTWYGPAQARWEGDRTTDHTIEYAPVTSETEGSHR